MYWIDNHEINKSTSARGLLNAQKMEDILLSFMHYKI